MLVTFCYSTPQLDWQRRATTPHWTTLAYGLILMVFSLDVGLFS